MPSDQLFDGDHLLRIGLLSTRSTCQSQHGVSDGRVAHEESGIGQDHPVVVKQLRSYLPDVVAAVGIPTRIVPHQLRHTYASEMVRAGIGLPALMKLLGHVNPEMTMRYVDVVGTDLQREFHLARSQPRHLAPQPKAPSFSPRAGLDGVVDSLLFAQHAIEMFRRSLPNGTPKHRLDQLANRLTKILTETRKLNPDG